ncbi:MAG: hypothetical protein J1E16_10630 [Muribaculaceae bacterium]|nr:hypothetical protein [Muribaculaceae bacterium]
MVVLACMVMVLLAIRQLSHFEGFDDSEETSHLKKEIDEDGNILSHNNIFSTLVEAPPEEPVKKENYKSNSSEPFSPKE